MEYYLTRVARTVVVATRRGPAGSETEEQDSPEEKDEQARAPMSPGRKEGGQVTVPK